MAGDNISIDPRAAAQTLNEMQTNAGAYVQLVNNLGQTLTQTSQATLSNPLNDQFRATGTALTNVGHAVNESVASFATALKGVIDAWRASDAHAGQAGEYTKPPFEGVQVAATPGEQVDVSVSKVNDLLAHLAETTTKLSTTFQNVQQDVTSMNRWRGASNSIGQSIDRFNQSVMPLNEEVTRMLGKLHEEGQQQIADFQKRDQSNYVTAG